MRAYRNTDMNIVRKGNSNTVISRGLTCFAHPLAAPDLVIIFIHTCIHAIKNCNQDSVILTILMKRIIIKVASLVKFFSREIFPPYSILDN